MNTIEEKLKELGSIRWLPWIGSNFKNLDPANKILLIGESHYYENEDNLKSQSSLYYSRAVVQEMAVDGHKWGGSIFFENINKLLVNCNTLDKCKREIFGRRLLFTILYNDLCKQIRNDHPKQIS